MDPTQLQKILDAFSQGFDKNIQATKESEDSNKEQFETIIEALGQQKSVDSHSFKFPTFHGNTSESVHDFVAQFERVADYKSLSDKQKLQVVQIILEGHARVWRNTLPGENLQDYKTFIALLKQKFSSPADRWLLRQELTARKQGAKESVTLFADDIKTRCQNLGIAKTEWVFHFINGLKPQIRRHVILAAPEDFEAAERAARVHESLGAEPSEQKIDTLIAAMANAQPSNYQRGPTGNSRPGPEDQLSNLKREILNELRKELRGSQHQGNRRPQYPTPGRNSRNFRGSPLCTICHKPGHTEYFCWHARDRNSGAPREAHFRGQRGPPNRPLN